MSERKLNFFKLEEYDDRLFKEVMSVNSQIQDKYNEFNMSLDMLKQQFMAEDNHDILNDPAVIDHINSINSGVKQFNNLVCLIIEMQKKLAKEMKRGEELKKEIEKFNNMDNDIDDMQKFMLLNEVVEKFDVKDEVDDDDDEMLLGEDIEDDDLDKDIEDLVKMEEHSVEILKVLGLKAIEKIHMEDGA